MASQKDIQELLRLLTTGRNKMPMMAAIGRVKALQVAGLKSIPDIANTDLPTLISAITSDEKTAKSLIAACKAQLKKPASTPLKRSSTTDHSPESKRLKATYGADTTPQTPSELEASLALPMPSTDEEAISKCHIYTNRAPLVLAFAVQLLKYTVPEQPPSSRLSLAQAVVSVNSRSKAVSLGIKERGKEEGDWGMGQPKLRVMGREVSVLKRSGYEWKEDAVKTEEVETVEEEVEEAQSSDARLKSDSQVQPPRPAPANTWTISSPITSKNSKFIARALTVSSSSELSRALSALHTNTTLSTASHNITASRLLLPSGSISETSSDDGETGGGRHLLGILQSSSLTNVLLVVSRWYGAIMLGPDRWRIMTSVSRDALSQRLRVAGVVTTEPLWGLDLESPQGLPHGQLPIHGPEGARSYILKAFPSPPPTASDTKEKKKPAARLDAEKEENLSLLLGALDLLFASWAPWISKDDLDKRAWSWYVAVRPDVQDGVQGWGEKGVVKCGEILNLRRKS
ncbi:hypothetical protein BJ875DRAFT_493730 [Amylocarpus encephaloides]|uniref:Impact N-terminal domain-containing protein n=1 Tax=Amylocarpus encephaloides TaxID=45428 RepID=A0A9P8C840_9HELO|nr:hypothetical protein BJ875DRAFT_493730 [Amylocarpus encephaloides]